jgi:hypothetical protein
MEVERENSVMYGSSVAWKWIESEICCCAAEECEMEMEKSKLLTEERVWVVRTFCRWDTVALAWLLIWITLRCATLLLLHAHLGLILPCPGKERLGRPGGCAPNQNGLN